jgi:ribosomal protein L33
VVCKDEIEKMMWVNYFNQSNASIIYRATQGRHRNYSVRRNSNETSGSMSLRSKSHTKPLQAHQEHQSRHIAPLWVQDAVSKNCQKCEVVFTLFRRRHHCRLCGALVCNECSSNREYIPTENKRVRVCDSCMLRLRAYGGVVATPNDGTTVVMNPFNMMDGIVEEKEEEDEGGEGDRKGEGSDTDDDDDDDVDIEEVGADAQEVAQVVAQVFEQDGGERKLETFPTKEGLRSAHVDATARKMQPSKKKAGRGKKKGRKTGTEQLVMSNQKYAAFMTRRRRQENT